MRKVVMMLAATLAAFAVGEVMALGLCPMYPYGQWNGIYYYYCKHEGMCSTDSMPTSGQSSMNITTFGCNGAACAGTPILLLDVKLKGDGKDQKDLMAHVTKTGGVKKKMKGRKNGGGPGKSEDPAFDFNLAGTKAKFVAETGGKLADRPVFVKAKDKNNNPQTFYFRVLELELEHPTNPAMKITALVGQQLDAVPATTEELMYAAHDGDFDHVLKNRAGELFHVVSFDEIKAP